MAAGQRANQWSAHPRAELSKNQAKSAKTWHYTKVNFAISHPTISACYAPHPLFDCRRSVTLSQSGEYATVLFGHRNWREWGEFMSHCSTKWASFLFSLREMIETGKGRPAPFDARVDDWD